MDKEYIVLKEIAKNPEITQRELAKLICCSVGSVNILLNKMVSKGLIYIKRVKVNKIIYMLTPTGIIEKLQRTSNYIKSNYNYIVDMQAHIRTEIENLATENGELFLLMENDEISALIRNSVKEDNSIKFLTDKDTCDESKTVVALSINNYNRFKAQYKNLINLLELI